MLRLIGILIGSALAIALLLFTLGTPQLSPSSRSGSVSDQPSSGSVSELQRASELIDSIETVTPKIPDTSLVTDPELDSSETDPELGAALVEQLFAPEASREIVRPTGPETVADEHWYAFWSPFRSEIAANGFVSKLQETTGIDYRVVKVRAGVYEVAFAYSDDADIEAKLQRISVATGLELSGG